MRIFVRKRKITNMKKILSLCFISALLVSCGPIFYTYQYEDYDPMLGNAYYNFYCDNYYYRNEPVIFYEDMYYLQRWDADLGLWYRIPIPSERWGHIMPAAEHNKHLGGNWASAAPSTPQIQHMSGQGGDPRQKHRDEYQRPDNRRGNEPGSGNHNPGDNNRNAGQNPQTWTNGQQSHSQSGDINGHTNRNQNNNQGQQPNQNNNQQQKQNNGQQPNQNNNQQPKQNNGQQPTANNQQPTTNSRQLVSPTSKSASSKTASSRVTGTQRNTSTANQTKTTSQKATNNTRKTSTSNTQKTSSSSTQKTTTNSKKPAASTQKPTANSQKTTSSTQKSTTRGGKR